MTLANQGRIQVKDVMLRRYLRLGESHTLHEVMGFLTDSHFEKEGLPFLVVIAEDGTFAGVLEPKAVLAAMLEGVQDGQQAESSLRNSAPVNLLKTAGHIMNRSIPTIHPNAFLDEAFKCIESGNTEVVGVLEDNRVIGLITARILFQQASALTVGALTGGVIPSPAD